VGVVKVSLSLLAVIVDCRDPRRQAEFWAHALTYRVGQRNPDEFLVSDPAGTGGALYFMKVPEPKTGKNRLHPDLVTSGSMEAEVARLVEAGAQLVEVRQDPASFDNPDTWTVMRDPEGNEFCVTSTSTLTGLD
jgi:predicted enzyme related to lactoylglutathione lyase